MTEKHIASSFDRDLESIQATVMTMGGLVEKSLRDATRALITHDVALAEAVRRGDRAIDELNLAVKTDAARLLALRSPTASDLRIVLSVMEITSRLERCGDYAKNMAKRTIAIAGSGDLDGTLVALGRMSAFVEAMIRDALDSFIQRDADRAAEIVERDLEADQMYNQVFRSVLTHMMENPRTITVGMHLHFIAKNVERVGDHATGLAEQTIYLVSGELPDDDRPKRDRTSLTNGERDE